MNNNLEAMNNMESLFLEYNDIVKNAYFDYYLEVEEKPFSVYDKSEEEFEKRLERNVKKWEYMPSKAVEGESPSEYFNGIEELDLLIEAFKKGSKICDRDLPNTFINKLRSHGEDAAEKLSLLAFDKALIEDDADRIISLMAIRILGTWKDDTYLGQMINLLRGYAGKLDIVAEEIKSALVAFGRNSIDVLVEEINTASEISESQVYMIMALAEAGESHKTEDSFQCLKNAFRRMGKKAIGAICLGVYGDGRAVPLLRGYVQRNIDTIDRMTFYEIKSQVERLGGNMDDIVFKGDSTYPV